ncbi:MAG: hypothetical protein COU35_04660 [Candidatus Magasanikbacteria bacterium CG10_big_fil_rev_8_21_14_0_10_47_10]|uniref:Uncharacterized protein n=1 Tax=Candidatus Magasanikbacteria bacterium CG10_big_fil_rev_8_21_14_0_10_47_10 TaxID=1974652 RepID=A0A2H0TPM8_9BACT|nr:MAG: hypothetical protein COU35_04660 [Candidatus Magasanikbacteria bacterium CG10_big_fil_rev_8_21_14_0_10_47_10]
MTHMSLTNILNRQSVDGSFADEDTLPSVFETAWALHMLHDNPDVKQSADAGKAATWLLQQKNEQWIFSDSVGIQFFVLSAITRHNPGSIHGAPLAHILTQLTSLELSEGGPYGSIPDSTTVDVGVNLMIAYFLSLLDVELPALTQLIGGIDGDSPIVSSAFPDESPIRYVLQKMHKINTSTTSNVTVRKTNDSEQRIMDMITDFARQQMHHTSLDMGNKALEQIQKTMRGNQDKQMPLMAYYTREALGSNGSQFSNKIIAKLGLTNIFFWTAFIIYDDFWDNDEAANPQILPTANLFARYYTHFFTNIFPAKPAFTTFFHALMDQLDAANTWETIYCRTTVENNIFSVPDVLPDYGDYSAKYAPASGHVLGPLALFTVLGQNVSSQDSGNLLRYFKHYLIGMQINDDAHDWEEDMQRGHLSTVVVMLLSYWKTMYPHKTTIHMVNDLPELQKIFWFKTIQQACTAAMYHTDLSRQALHAISVIENMAPLEYYINSTEKTARDAMQEQQHSTDFISAYKKINH